jgi:LPS sulfotransferase NodH
VIHLKRRNILASHVSRKIASITGNWTDYAKNTRGKALTFALDFDECQRVFQATRNWESEADAFFAQQPKLEVLYEDLAQNFARPLAQVEMFLGLAQSRSQATTPKQARRSLAKTITNYHELKARFAGTPWAEFFTE